MTKGLEQTSDTRVAPSDVQGQGPLALDVRGLWAGYGGEPVLRGVDFTARQGEFIAVIGPNGAGKSTLFKVALGLMPKTRGDVRIFGGSGRAGRASTGYMPQVELVDWDFPVTVFDVALMGRYGALGLLRRPSAEDRAAADASLDRVGMLSLSRTSVGELSGGQRRRALLARAIANDPKLLILDEPMAGLDAPAQHQILGVLRALTDRGVAVVMSTHDLSCVSTSCDRVYALRGEVIAEGPPQEVLTEEVLGRTFGQHLLMVHVNGQAYAYQHHTHKETGGA